MVSLTGLAATVTVGSVACRKLYEYYWKNPNINIFSSFLKSRASILRSLYIMFDKSSTNYSYSLTPANLTYPQNHLITTSILFKYLKHDKNIQSLEHETNNRNERIIKNLMMNGIEPEIKKFLQINSNVLENKQYYEMVIRLKDIERIMQMEISCERAIPVVEEISVKFEQLLDDDRDFLVFLANKGQLQKIRKSYYLICSQDKQRPKFRYSPYEVQYSFISEEQLKKYLQQQMIVEMWETRNDNPIYKSVKSVQLLDKTISLSNTIHKANKSRFTNILNYGQDYYPMTIIDL